MTKFIKTTILAILGCMMISPTVFADAAQSNYTNTSTTSNDNSLTAEAASNTTVNITENTAMSGKDNSVKDKEYAELRKKQDKEIEGNDNENNKKNDNEKWFHFSFKGFLLQVLVAITLIVLPGCYIYMNNQRPR